MIVTLQLDGKSAGNALVKSVQASAAARQIISVDLLRVSATDRLHVSVPIALTGDAPGVHQGGVLEQTLHALNLRCSPDAVPERIIHDLSAMGLGASIHVKHLSLPPGSDLLDDPEEVVAVMLAPTVPAAEEVFEVVEESGAESEGAGETA